VLIKEISYQENLNLQPFLYKGNVENTHSVFSQTWCLPVARSAWQRSHLLAKAKTKQLYYCLENFISKSFGTVRPKGVFILVVVNAQCATFG